MARPPFSTENDRTVLFSCSGCGARGWVSLVGDTSMLMMHDEPPGPQVNSVSRGFRFDTTSQTSRGYARMWCDKCRGSTRVELGREEKPPRPGYAPFPRNR